MELEGLLLSSAWNISTSSFPEGPSYEIMWDACAPWVPLGTLRVMEASGLDCPFVGGHDFPPSLSGNMWPLRDSMRLLDS